MLIRLYYLVFNLMKVAERLTMSTRWSRITEQQGSCRNVPTISFLLWISFYCFLLKPNQIDSKHLLFFSQHYFLIEIWTEPLLSILYVDCYSFSADPGHRINTYYIPHQQKSPEEIQLVRIKAVMCILFRDRFLLFLLLIDCNNQCIWDWELVMDIIWVTLWNLKWHVYFACLRLYAM